MCHKLSILLITCLISLAQCLTAQELAPTNFEQWFLDWNPIGWVELSEKNQGFIEMVHHETRSATNQTPSEFNRADYYNVLNVLSVAGAPEPIISTAFERLMRSEGACEYGDLVAKHMLEDEGTQIIRPQMEAWIATCAQLPAPSEINSEIPAGLDAELVRTLRRIDEKDERYRSNQVVNWQRQNTLDAENQADIDALFAQYQTYLGKSLVGEEQALTMWAVIQHSNPDMMERYLPVLHRAYLDKELPAGPLKMTLDRYHALRFGYQFFGSQGGDLGVPSTDDATRSAILKKYNLQ